MTKDQTAEDFLDKKRREIKNRLDELKPLAEEYAKLKTADEALGKTLGPIPEATPAATAKKTPKPARKPRKNPRKKREPYTDEFKAKAVARATETNPAAAAKEFDVSRTSVKNWLTAAGVL